MTIKVKVVCKSCGYTWYPEKGKWERPGKEPDCPNQECQYYGTRFRELNALSIWAICGDVDENNNY